MALMGPSDDGLPPQRGSVAVAAALLLATVLYTVACLVSKSYGFAFFSIPIYVGCLAGALQPARPYRAAFIALALALLLSIVTLREGVVCILFSLPVLLPLLVAGASIGSTFVRHVKARRARQGGLSLLLFVAFGSQLVEAANDDPQTHPIHVAGASVHVDASPETVFAVLTSGKLHVAPRWPWFIRIGLPMPSDMVVERPGLHGRIRFEFAQMTALATITQWKPAQQLAYDISTFRTHDLPFHITRLGKGPAYGFRNERVQDWLTFLDTRYIIDATPDGGSVLHRRVVWRRHLAPGVYFSWLQQTVMEKAQERLLELIAERAGAEEEKRRAAGAKAVALR